jgi:hypothetical protein
MILESHDDLNNWLLLKTALFNDWYEKYCSVRKKEHAKIKCQFEIHIFPKLSKLPVDTITMHEWFEVLEALAAVYPDTTMSILTQFKADA